MPMITTEVVIPGQYETKFTNHGWGNRYDVPVKAKARIYVYGNFPRDPFGRYLQHPTGIIMSGEYEGSKAEQRPDGNWYLLT